VAVVGRDLYVLEYDYIPAKRREDWLPRVRKLAADGTVTVIAQVKSRPQTGRALEGATESSSGILDLLPPPKMHSAVVHFPIVLSCACVAAALLALVFWRRYAWRIQALVLFVALYVACVVAEATGNRAEMEIPYGDNGVAPVVWETMRHHTSNAGRLKTIAFGGALVSLVTLIPRRNVYLGGLQLSASGLVLCAAIGAAAFAIQTGHWGGDLVYGHGVGTDPLVRSLTEKSATHGRAPPETPGSPANPQ
jgi:uncharacterized membrane protein